MATAFRWAAASWADVIQQQLGGATYPTPIIHSAIVDITKPGGSVVNGRGCVVVFAAGNIRSAVSGTPRNTRKSSLLVQQTTTTVRWDYSNYGP